jgi:hypothetical protein
MEAIDRRRMLRNILCGAVAGGVGLELLSKAVEAAPLMVDKGLTDNAERLVEDAQVVIVGPGRRRRRRRVCWWHRGRQVCDWRW